MGGDAGVAPAKDGVPTILPRTCRTASAWASLIAGQLRLGAEIRAERTLHQVAAHRRQITQLRAGAQIQSLLNGRIGAPYPRVCGNVAHTRQCTEAQPPGARLYVSERQSVDVNEPAGRGNAVFHPAEKLCPTSDAGRLRISGKRCNGTLQVSGTFVGKRDHRS